MGFLNKYPYLDEHELNLDWLIATMRKLEIEFDEFKVVNNITFSGTWDITKQYPAWTIVSDNNIGYVSLQPVPAGIPLSNGSYWVEVIDYTAQIAGLENRVIALEGDMITAQGDITNLQAVVSRMTMSGRTFIFVGDSYAYQADTWVTSTVQYCGITNYSNEAISGSSFKAGSFKSQIENYTGDRNAVTDIVVGGGLNDSIFNSTGSDYTNLKVAIADFATYAKANYPNAKLWLAYMGNACDDSPVIGAKTYDCRIWCKWTYNTEGRKNGFNIITGCDYALAQTATLYQADRAHPNQYGAEAIAQILANGLLNGQECLVYPEFSSGIAAIGNNVLRYTPYINYTLEKDNFSLYMKDGFTVEIGVDYASFTSSNAIDMVTMSNLYFNKKFSVPTVGFLLNYNSKTFIQLPMVLEFYQNKVSARLDTINAAGTNYETFTANNTTAAITFARGMNIVVPAYYIN